MEARSAHSLELDPYRAGVELADALAPIAPELVVLFSSIDFQGAKELSEAFFDVIGNEQLVLIGCTGEGFFESGRVADVGSCAIGINFGGKVRLSLAAHPRIGSDSAHAMERNLEVLTATLGAKPDLCLVLCDFSNDGTAIESVLQRHGVVAVGGFAGDDMLEMNRCSLFANRAVLEDGIVALGMVGDCSWDIHLAHDLEPIGRTGTVTSAQGTRLCRVDDLSAVDFTEAAIRRPVSKVDQGIVTLNVLDKDNPEGRYLRAIVTNSVDAEGSFSLFGGIRDGSRVQVCIAQPEAIVREVYRVAELARSGRFQPRAGIIISCAGRKHLLGNRIEHEVTAVREAFGGGLPLVGFPSFGEIGPLRKDDGYTGTFFHNMTYVLLLLGE